MKTLHENSHNPHNPLTPEAGQREFSYSNGERGRCSPLAVSIQQTFSIEERKQFFALARILKQIHIRLIIEGYTIKDGRIYKE